MILVNPPGSTIIISLRQQNKGSCSVGDLNGGYTIEMRGTTGLPAGPAVPFARLGRVVFDGQGTFSTQSTVSSGGKLGPDNFSGSYTVQSSCEFTMNYGGGNTWAGVLMDKSTAANIMVTGPTVFPPGIPFPVAGLVVSGTLRKQ